MDYDSYACGPKAPERNTVDELVEIDPNLYVDERGVVRMREMREVMFVDSIGGEIAWPDVVVCAPRWTGRGAPREEREYVQVVRCAECRHCKSASTWYGMSDRIMCAFRPNGMHITTPDGYCSDGERREA